ncbi:4Fe-4S binding protein [Desulfobacula sp.]
MKNNIHIWRRTIQTLVAVFFILVPILNTKGFSFVWGNFLNMHVGSLTFSDPLAVLQVVIKNRYFPTGLLISTSMVLGIAFFLGTVFCSWICPYGLLSELINRFAKKTRPGKLIHVNSQEISIVVKVVIFCTGFFIFLLFFSRPVLNLVSMPFQYSNIFQYIVNQKQLSFGFWIISAILVLEFLFRTRIWCRWICPQSLLIALVKLFNPLRLKVIFKEKKCISGMTPSPCRKACSLDLDPRNLNAMNDAQCTNCGDCIDACRKMGGALGFSFGKQ